MPETDLSVVPSWVFLPLPPPPPAYLRRARAEERARIFAVAMRDALNEADAPAGLDPDRERIGFRAR